MTRRIGGRLTYLGLAAATIALGLWVHRGANTLGADTRDVLGDAIWGAMIAWLVGAVAPGARLLNRSVVALSICVAVELSQLIHTPSIDGLRSTTLGGLVLGSGFNPRDLVAYAIGVVVAALLEQAAIASVRALEP